ncbi:MAG TPA: hypothetical protein PK299_08805 [Anaerolineales bacterium]|nr:hypothetical protein [Anaerolineales bacterium]
MSGLLAIFALQWGILLLGGRIAVSFQPHDHQFYTHPTEADWQAHWQEHLAVAAGGQTETKSGIDSVYTYLFYWWQLYSMPISLPVTFIGCIITAQLLFSFLLPTVFPENPIFAVDSPPPRTLPCFYIR